MKYSLLKLGFFNLILLLSGCIVHNHGEDDDYGGTFSTTHQATSEASRCMYDTECYTLEYCGEAGYCYSEVGCQSDRGCGFHETCHRGRCLDVRGCTMDSECGSGSFCNNGDCELIGPCEVDLDCPTAMFCTFDQLCDVLPEGQCIIDEDCFDDQQCSAAGFCF